MKIKFENYDIQIKDGVKDFFDMHKISVSKGDAEPLTLTVKVEVNGEKKIKLHKNNNDVKICIEKDYQLFRALVLLKQNYNKDCFEYEEPVMFDTCCAMIDGSQASSLLNISSCKKMMLYLASMGYNMMMLYCEDCYELKGEPYFGNMRPKYTNEDFMYLDDYGYSLGIELVPCIQTLGHLTEAIKRPPYAKISDRPDILLAGCEEVYTLIDKMILNASNCFRSRRIHIGLDEAWDLGLGNYLKLNGYRPQWDIMTEHLKRVNEIVKKYNMRPMMWNDMFFRGKSKDNEYYDETISFNEDDKKFVPDGMSIIYWDYYHYDKEFYANNLRKSKMICDNVIFAGCSRNVRTFGSHLKKTIETTDAALSACKEENIKEVMATVWGDDHRESSAFATLPGLMYFAEHMYNETSPNLETVKERFKLCIDMEWEAFADIEKFDIVPGYNDSETNNLAVSRVCMWQDIMLGLCDANMKNMNMAEHYLNLYDKMKDYGKKYTDFKYLFDFYSQLALVISQKQYMGIKLVKMYKSGDKSGLKKAAEEELPKLMTDMKKLRLLHREYFFKECKPIGWEILDIRYGGAIMRTDTAVSRIKDYLSGYIDKIDEFEEERLSFTGIEGDLVPDVQTYQRLCSASRL